MTDADTYYSKIIRSDTCEFYAYKILQVKEQFYKPFESVKEEALQMMQEQSKRLATIELANKMIAESNLQKPTKRTINAKESTLFNEEDIKKIFTLKEGDVLEPIFSKDAKSVVIVKLEAINIPNESDITEAEINTKITSIKEEQRYELSRHILEEFRKKYKVKINYGYIQN